MSGTLSGLFFPCAAIVFSTLICITYFSKKRIDLLENKIFSNMIVLILLDSIMCTIIQIIAYNGLDEFETKMAYLFNKLDFTCLILYSTCIFLYTLVTIKKQMVNTKKIIRLLFGISALLCVVVIFSPIQLLQDDIYCSITGVSASITFIVCGIYILLSMLLTIFNLKSTDKRHIPILLIAVVIIFLLIMYVVNPYFVIISIILTFINLSMFFTIENPDLKMIEELNIAKEQAEKAAEQNEANN